MQDANIISIAIVDDHPLLRAGIRRFIESYPNIRVNFEASDGAEFLQKLSHSDIPHILILDINMPRMNGYELLEMIGKNHPDIKPIVLSMVSGEDAITHLFSLGACACMNKSAGIETLIEIINEVFEKGMYTSNVKWYGNLIKSKQSYTKKGFYGQSQLTHREAVMLPLLASDMTYTEIAKQEFLEEKTIQNYRDRIYHKLGIKSRNELTLYAIRNGLLNPYS